MDEEEGCLIPFDFTLLNVLCSRNTMKRNCEPILVGNKSFYSFTAILLLLCSFICIVIDLREFPLRSYQIK